MMEIQRFTSVTFRNYKALKKYSVSLGDFNVLVGPNNAGKSTIIGAFRILAEGIRKASAKNPEYIRLNNEEEKWGYRVPLDDLPVATENIFSNYDDSQPAIAEFQLSCGKKLRIVFPETNVCYLFCETSGRQIRSTSDFKREYKASVGFVPVLGPVEHNELLYQPEAARKALLTHRASRNFRNIWYHYPEDFEEYRELIRSTWPGMDIQKPEIDHSHGKPIIHMFCPEERYPREIFWAGFGFQVWCQMLTYILRAKKYSLLIIDEPDIYLHSDLQRQLVGLLKNMEPDILIATHSTEIISEADPGDLLIINKKERAAKRIKELSQLQSVFEALGSNLNPTLTQLAKSRRAVFIEGKDFKILSGFARKLKKQSVANRTNFAAIQVEGYNPQRVCEFAKGMEITLGTTIIKAVIFDRDYRSSDEVSELRDQLKDFTAFAHIHDRKELENYLLEPKAIDRALEIRVADHNKRTNSEIVLNEKAEEIFNLLTDKMKHKMIAQFLSKRIPFEKSKKSGIDQSTITQKLIEEFEDIWSSLSGRISIIPGKEFLSQMNQYLQEHYKITLTVSAIISAMLLEEIPAEIKDLIERLDKFQKTSPICGVGET